MNENYERAMVPSFGDTLVLANRPQDTPEGGRLGAMQTRAIKWVNLVFLMDVSGSVPEEGANELLGHGLPAIFGNLRELGRLRGYRFNVCMMAVSTDVSMLLDPCMLEEALEVGFAHVTPHGSTNLEEGLKQAVRIIDAWKEDQDAKGLVRRSSMVISLSDFQATNSRGCRTPLSDERVADVKARIADATTNFFGIGYGDVDEEVMHQLGGGVKYSGGDFRELDAWQHIALLIERGSMSTRSGADAVRFAGDARSLLDGDVIEIDESVWEIVE